MSNRPIFRPVDYVLSDSGVVDDFSLEFSRGFEHREILTCQETFRTFERGASIVLIPLRVNPSLPVLTRRLVLGKLDAAENNCGKLSPIPAFPAKVTHIGRHGRGTGWYFLFWTSGRGLRFRIHRNTHGLPPCTFSAQFFSLSTGKALRGDSGTAGLNGGINGRPPTG